MSFQRLLLSQAKKINSESLLWAFPVTLGFTWFIWDAIDQEFLISLNLAKDPDTLNNRIEKERLARLDALKTPKPTILKGPALKETAAVEVDEDETEEEEASTEDKEEPPTEDEEAPVDEDSDDVPAGEDGDIEAAAKEDEEEEESDDDDEEEEDSEVPVKPLYDPVKGKKLGQKDVWDNYTIKAVNMSEDDDDDDEEEEEEDEEEEADEE